MTILVGYRGTSLVKNGTPLGPYRRPVPRALGGSQGDGRIVVGEVHLNWSTRGRFDLNR